MSIKSRSKQYGVVFGHWQIKKYLGSGYGGKSAVFKLGRGDSTRGDSALRVISLMEEKGNFNAFPAHRREAYNQAKKECKKSALKEVQLIQELSSHPNIVDFLGHKFTDWSEGSGFGFDLLIRMEYLEDLRCRMLEGRQYAEAEVLKIGRDICSALVRCHGKGVLHGNIKPETIFIGKEGNYKLGDLGVSRILNTASTAVAVTGNKAAGYTAPEQIFSQHDKGSDLYSLGLVLYELSNGNRLPFASTGYARPVDVEKRQSGKPLPAPCNAGEALSAVILKACAYRKEDRYQTAEEFLADLDRLAGGAVPKTSENDKKGGGKPGVRTIQHGSGDTGQRDPKKVVLAAAAVVLLCICLLFLMGIGRKSAENTPSEPEHIHSWIDATCTGSRYCPDCGLASGEPLGHEWTEATCTSAKHCIVCNQTAGEARGHDWAEATCTRAKYCVICKQTEGEAKGHSWTEATYDAPKTCTECGATEGTALRPEPKPLSEFAISAAVGKVWIRSTSPYYDGTYHTKADAPNCWKDWSKPGYTGGAVRDNQGNEYDHGIHVDGWDSGEYYYEIRLDGKYTTFSGICACPEKNAIIISFVYDTSRKCTKYFEVYGDGKLLFTSATMRYDYDPQAFSIDVTGVQVLKILYPATTGPNEVATIYDGLLS